MASRMKRAWSALVQDSRRNRDPTLTCGLFLDPSDAHQHDRSAREHDPRGADCPLRDCCSDSMLTCRWQRSQVRQKAAAVQ